MGKIIFITGTDTDAGKTVLTGLLLAHLRGQGVRALALKPFCSGNDADVRILQEIQGAELTNAEVNPWFAAAPVAPVIGLAESGIKPSKTGVLKYIHSMAKRAEVLLVEGAGGLLSPLGEDLDALELIRELKCEVLVAGKNRLGCVNHFSLTLLALKNAGVKKISAVLMPLEGPDASGVTNPGMLRNKAGFIGVYEVPWLGNEASTGGALKNNAKKMQITLAGILGSGKKRPLLRDPQAADGKSGRKKVENTCCQPRKKPVA